MEFGQLSKHIIGCAIEVHRELGPGLLESTYEKCLLHELKALNIECIAQMPLPVIYKGVHIDCGFRIDLLVEGSFIVELKSVDSLLKIHKAQILTYMKLANIKTGLLINFNTKMLKNGIKRFVL